MNTIAFNALLLAMLFISAFVALEVESTAHAQNEPRPGNPCDTNPNLCD